MIYIRIFAAFEIFIRTFFPFPATPTTTTTFVDFSTANDSMNIPASNYVWGEFSTSLETNPPLIYIYIILYTRPYCLMISLLRKQSSCHRTPRRINPFGEFPSRLRFRPGNLFSGCTCISGVGPGL